MMYEDIHKVKFTNNCWYKKKRIHEPPWNKQFPIFCLNTNAVCCLETIIWILLTSAQFHECSPSRKGREGRVSSCCRKQSFTSPPLMYSSLQIYKKLMTFQKQLTVLHTCFFIKMYELSDKWLMKTKTGIYAL